MGRCILKVNRDEDYYVVWSSVVDYWIFAGTRKHIVEYWKEEYGRQGMEGLERMMERADEWGSSAMRQFGHWEDELLWLGPRGQVRRSDLEAFVEAYDNDHALRSLIIPHEDWGTHEHLR